MGTKRTCQPRCATAAFRGEAENICSHRAFPVLAPNGHAMAAPLAARAHALVEKADLHGGWPSTASIRLLTANLPFYEDRSRTIWYLSANVCFWRSCLMPRGGVEIGGVGCMATARRGILVLPTATRTVLISR